MSIDAMKLALEALEEYQAKGAPFMRCDAAADALRAAIKQTQGTHWEGCEEVHFECRQPEQEPRRWQRLTEEEIARREKVNPIRVRIMQEAYDLADRDDSEGYNSVKVMCSDVLAMINKLLDERQWQGLTDEELAEFSELKLGAYDLCLEVEAKLKEKNT